MQERQNQSQGKCQVGQMGQLATCLRVFPVREQKFDEIWCEVLHGHRSSFTAMNGV